MSATDDILAELMPLEPIFHTAAFGRTLAEFAQRMAADYWETGASGQPYSREFILEHLAANPPVDAEAAGWRASDHAVRALGEDTFLLTYTLDQNGRVTRRATVWQRGADGWKILYHQGTMVAGTNATQP